MTDPTIHPDRPLGDDGDASMIRREEELRVRTERIVSGRVIVRKRIVEQEQTLTVTVRHEELDVVEEGPDAVGAGRADDSPLDDAGERVLVLFAERPVVTMERVPVERVVVRTVTTTENQAVSAQLSREVVTVEGDGVDGVGVEGEHVR